MSNIVYIKTVEEYDDIFKKKYTKMPLWMKRGVFLYKRFFNIITKKVNEECNVWVLPIREDYSTYKIRWLLKRIAIHTDNTYVIPDVWQNKKVLKEMNEFGIQYLTGNKLKKLLMEKALEYISNIQKNNISDMEITILANQASEMNLYLIEKLSKLVKSVKIVSSNIYHFKNLETKLYEEDGIAIQFSNSYQKSLAKSKIIVNLDFSEIDINEYKLLDKAIIINCIEDSIKIKSKLFNGVIINSYQIKFKKELMNQFKKNEIDRQYNYLLLYESTIYQERNIQKLFERIEDDKAKITNLIGNNGIIDKKEIKNISKKLDKSLKTE